MKKLLFILFCVAIVATVGLLVSCTSGGAAYYVRFKADGQSYEFSKGFNDVGGGDASAFLITGDSFLVIIGTTDDFSSDIVGDSNSEVDNAFFVVIRGTTVGTYDDIGETGDFEIGYIAINGVLYEPSAISITISVINEVGGTIEGTFTATLVPEGGGDSVEITEGEFKLYRAEDNSVLPPAE
jgi:hypothetical protein